MAALDLMASGVCGVSARAEWPASAAYRYLRCALRSCRIAALREVTLIQVLEDRAAETAKRTD